MPLSPYRPNAYYYRKIAREGTPEEMREALLELIEERDKLRGWVREQGMIPPLFDLPESKAQEIIASPASVWQKDVSDQFQRHRE